MNLVVMGALQVNDKGDYGRLGQSLTRLDVGNIGVTSITAIGEIMLTLPW